MGREQWLTVLVLETTGIIQSQREGGGTRLWVLCPYLSSMLRAQQLDL